MRLVTYQNSNGETRTGLRVSDSKSKEQELDPRTGLILDIGEAYEWVKTREPNLSGAIPDSVATSMIALIENESEVMPALDGILNAYEKGDIPSQLVQPESSTTLLAPIPLPPTVRDGYAFRQHVEAARRNRGVPMIPEFDEFPVFYFTNPYATTGPGNVNVLPKHMEKLDFELEAAIVIGKNGRNLSASEADNHIFGYMVFNDWSARALQMQEMKMSLGPAKGKDFANSFGPYLIPRKSLFEKRIESDSGERFDLEMKAWVGGKQVSQGNLKDMTWTFAQIVERASYGVGVHVGEVIGSGTVGTGCFLELNGSKITDNQWIQEGETVELWIEELGKLSNSIHVER